MMEEIYLNIIRQKKGVETMTFKNDKYENSLKKILKLMLNDGLTEEEIENKILYYLVETLKEERFQKKIFSLTDKKSNDDQK